MIDNVAGGEWQVEFCRLVTIYYISNHSAVGRHIPTAHDTFMVIHVDNDRTNKSSYVCPLK
jgi:hypothetical protein